jgi:hypothetical protein
VPGNARSAIKARTGQERNADRLLLVKYRGPSSPFPDDGGIVGEEEAETGRIASGRVSSPQQCVCSLDGTAVLIRPVRSSMQVWYDRGGRGCFQKRAILSPAGRWILPGGLFARILRRSPLRLPGTTGDRECCAPAYSREASCPNLNARRPSFHSLQFSAQLVRSARPR